MALDLGWQNRDAKQGREQHCDNPRHEQRDSNDDEQGVGEFTGVAGVEADRDKSGDGDQRSRQHGKGRGGVNVRCGLLQGIARFEPRHHHFNGDHGVVDQKAERDDQGAERNALQ